MKFIDFNGLQHFYEKIKASFAILNSSGKVPYKQLPDKVKKVKYIKKEKRYLFHKSIPISFEIDSEGNYNSQINGRYDDWYYSKRPVFRIKQGKKFRLFIKTFDIENFIEVPLEDLTYWHPNTKNQVNLIEKSDDALICNAPTIYNSSFSNIVPIGFSYSVFYGEDSDVRNIVIESNIWTVYKVEYNYDTNTYNVYVMASSEDKPTPWNKNFKWVGRRIECILPTTIDDISRYIEYSSLGNMFNGIISKGNILFNKFSIRYYRKIIKEEAPVNKTRLKIVLRRISYKEDNKIKSRYNIIRCTYKNYRKQASKFEISKGILKRVE